MVTKVGLFSHKIGHNSVCTNARAAEFATNRVFWGDGLCNVTIEIFPGTTLATMVTKIGLFCTKSAITRLAQMP